MVGGVGVGGVVGGVVDGGVVVGGGVVAGGVVVVVGVELGEAGHAVNTRISASNKTKTVSTLFASISKHLLIHL